MNDAYSTASTGNAWCHWCGCPTRNTHRNKYRSNLTCGRVECRRKQKAATQRARRAKEGQP